MKKNLLCTKLLISTCDHIISRTALLVTATVGTFVIFLTRLVRSATIMANPMINMTVLTGWTGLFIDITS